MCFNSTCHFKVRNCLILLKIVTVFVCWFVFNFELHNKFMYDLFQHSINCHMENQMWKNYNFHDEGSNLLEKKESTLKP